VVCHRRILKALGPKEAFHGKLRLHAGHDVHLLLLGIGEGLRVRLLECDDGVEIFELLRPGALPVLPEGGKIIAGGGVLLLVIFALPIFKWLNRMLRRATPYVFWTVIFVIFFSLSKISHEMTVISFAGSLGNILGAICFAIEKRRIRRETGEL